MNMANTEKFGTDESNKLPELDESFRKKYIDILEALRINELKRFDKTKTRLWSNPKYSKHCQTLTKYKSMKLHNA